MKKIKVLWLIGVFVGIQAASSVALNSMRLTNPVRAQNNNQTEKTWASLDYAPAPADNPLKGFMPFYDAYGSANRPIANDFPHSMEWVYVPLRNLMNGDDSFTFNTGLEPQLQSVANRGHQAAMRVYLDYPSKPSGIPQYLLDGGLKVRQYTFFGNTMRPSDSVSPDYDDPHLVAALESFIAHFGARYDGDPRIGYITLGLIGFWGEWHTWPMDGYKQETSVYKAAADPKEENWMPSAETQERIIKAYDDAFNATRLLLRYPMLPPPGQQALPGQRANYGSFKYNIGYHDDSFAYNTMYGLDWYFMGKMAWAGGINIWKTEPIGGELRPEIQLSVWADPPTRKDSEDFSSTVDGTHVTWLIAHSLFTTKSLTPDTAAYKAALAGAQRMGYEFYVSDVKLLDISTNTPLDVAVRLQNRGVAPFYYNWKVELGVLDSAGTVVKTYDPEWNLTTLLPTSAGETPYNEWTYSDPAHGLKPGIYTLLLHVVNPLSNGKALRFANTTQDADLMDWLTLGRFTVSR
jgi:hypothetical protein